MPQFITILYLMLATILYYLVKTLHCFLPLLLLVGPFVLKIKYLFVLLVINIYIVTDWYLYGKCFLTDVEHAINPEQNKTYTKKSFILIAIENQMPFIDDKILLKWISSVPLFSTIVCAIRIYQQCIECNRPTQ